MARTPRNWGGKITSIYAIRIHATTRVGRGRVSQGQSAWEGWEGAVKGKGRGLQDKASEKGERGTE